MVGSPTSSTTPSPPMPFAVASAAGQPEATESGLINSHEYLTPEERREREALKARLREKIHYQQIARNIRTRILYANYKVTHNVAHLTFDDLEASARQETSAARVPNPTTQARAFVAAATAAASGDSQPLQRRGSMAPPTTIPSNASAFSLRGLQRNVTDGANAAQSLYASILAQPPPRRARTVHNTDTQPAAATSNSKQANSSRRSKEQRHRSDDYTSVAERTRGHKNTEAPASGSGSASKRKAPASSSRGKANKRRRGEEPAVASRDDDVDLQAAATLTDLFRSSRSSFNAGTAQSPPSQVSDHSDVVSSQHSVGYQQSSARTQPGGSPLISAASTVPVQGSPTTPPRVEAQPLQRTATAGSSSSVPSIQHLTATSSASAGPVDQEAIKLLYFLHESPSPARPQLGASQRERDVHDAAVFRALSGKTITEPDVQMNARALFSGDDSRSVASANGSAAQSSLSRQDSTGTVYERHSPGLEHLPPHARKQLVQEPAFVIDSPLSSDDVEMRNSDGPPPTMRVTPPTPVAPVPKGTSPQRDELP